MLPAAPQPDVPVVNLIDPEVPKAVVPVARERIPDVLESPPLAVHSRQEPDPLSVPAPLTRTQSPPTAALESPAAM